MTDTKPPLPLPSPQPQPTPSHPSHSLKGRLLVLLSCLIFSLGYFFIKLVHYGPIDTGFMRGLFTTLFAYAVGRVRGEVFFDGYANHRMAVRRAFFGSISSIFINAATKMVKLSVFTVVSRAKGLIYIYLGVIILGNKFSWTTVAIGVVSIFGN